METYTTEHNIQVKIINARIEKSKFDIDFILTITIEFDGIERELSIYTFDPNVYELSLTAKNPAEFLINEKKLKIHCSISEYMTVFVNARLMLN